MVAGIDPVVLVVTVSVPVADDVPQFTVKAAVTEPPAGPVTVWGLALVTGQFAGTPDSVTVYVPARSVAFTVPLGAIDALPGCGPVAVTV